MAQKGAHQSWTAPAQQHVEVELDKRGDGRLRQGIARGDVDLLNLVGQTMDDGGQQAFVAEHDGCAPSVLVALLVAQPRADIAGLNVLGGCRDAADVLRLAEVAVDGVGSGVQLVGEVLQVLGNVASGFMLLHTTTVGVRHVVVVEVPVEIGLAGILEVREELLLYLLQQVETHKEVAVVGELLGRVCRQGLTNLPVEGALVGQTLFGQPLVEVVIDVGKTAPQAQEALFELGLVLLGKLAEEMAQQLALLVGQVA